ncbi:MAG: hypothetical protein ABSG43_26795, partial [Solirubrobacteraceae bacterium]
CDDRRQRRRNQPKTAVRPPAASPITNKSGDSPPLYASRTQMALTFHGLCKLADFDAPRDGVDCGAEGIASEEEPERHAVASRAAG